MSILFPLVYLFAGWWVGRFAWDLKASASWMLTKVIIPVVIVYNVSTRFGDMESIIVATAIGMLAMLGVSRLVTRDPVVNLCFCYLNIGWLGLPVAGAVFGGDAATIIIAAYVGSSIVGNSVGAAMLSPRAFGLKKLLQAPPVLALVVGIILIPVGPKVIVWFSDVYNLAKFLMSFLGMGVLGIWLAKTTISLADFRSEIRPFLQRSGCLVVIVTALYWIARTCHQGLITDNPAVLYLFCLLPPAANIIVLETHYLGSGRSARPISCGTCISIIAIAIYVALILGGRHWLSL